MKEIIITQLVSVLVSSLGPMLAKRAVDALLDVAENAIADSATRTDDAILIPVISAIRSQLDISDNDQTSVRAF